MSRNRQLVDCFKINPWWISVVSMPRLSRHEVLLRNPNWKGERIREDSNYQPRRYKISLSRTLRRQEVREIGRSLPGEDLGMRNTKECCQEIGKEPESNMELRTSSKIVKYSSGKRESILLSIPSNPGEERVFKLRVTDINSWREKGQSNILHE